MEKTPAIIWLDEVDSTNKYAITHFDELDDCTLVVAGCQTSGRGRRERTWISPAGENIYASFVLKELHCPVYHSSWIGSLATLDFLRQYMPGHMPWLKWPNDIYCGIKKISGMLCEVKTGKGNRVEGVVIGIGINVNMPQESLDSIDQPATSLAVETSASYNVKEMAQKLAFSLKQFYTLSDSKPGELYNIWKNENFLLGKEVEVISDCNSVTRGVIADIGRSGELIMDVDGEKRIFMSGDVSIRKTPEFYNLIK